MSEKSRKSGKSNKKADSKSNGEAPASTKNGKDKGKAAKGDAGSDPNQAEKPKRLFENWTGKTPQSLLHEQNQKNSWEKLTFDMAKRKHGFVGTAVLMKKNKKTGQMDKVLMSPSNIGMPTAAEARHVAATYALHRLNYDKPMYRVLPPEHREFWHQFEKERLESPQNAWMYTADPFYPPTQPTQKPTKDTGASMQITGNHCHSADTSDASYDRLKPTNWDALPMVHMSEDNRTLVEKTIKELGGLLQDDQTSLADRDAGKRAQIEEHLLSMGFRKAHVLESLEFAVTESDALDWLCVHVPEDDLPPSFMSANYKATFHTVSHTTFSLARDWLITRMQAAGFSRTVCEEALSLCQDDEFLAWRYLLRQLAHGLDAYDDRLPEREEGEKEQAQDELMALESIFEDKFRQISEDWYEIRLDGRNDENVAHMTLEFCISPHRVPQYPQEPPIVLVRSPKLPAYIRLAVMQKLYQHCTQSLVGGPMIYGCADWLEEHASAIVANPPRLKEITDGLSEVQRKFTEMTVASKGLMRPPESKRSTKPPNPQQLADRNTSLLQRQKNLARDSTYQDMMVTRRKLPAWSFKETLLNTLDANQIIIVSGETGCGKTTQVPQFILDHFIEAGHVAEVNIVCTQPRRISAMGVADRVTKERCSKLGEQVGYAIRGETRSSADTSLLFCTTGVLLRRIQSNPDLKGVTHVIIDEVHERSVDSDLLLVIMRQMLKKNSRLKLILMSATLNQESFSTYFDNAPCITIPGFTHPVEDFYLEDVLRLTNYRPEWQNVRDQLFKAGDTETDSDVAIQSAIASQEKSGKIDYDLIASIVKYIVSTDNPSGDVLIFLPGSMEISRCVNQLGRISANKKLRIYPLHAGLSPQEQTSVFTKTAENEIKVVVATNIAETSITVDGIVHVIDCGRVKQTEYDPSDKLMRLVETWSSAAAARQRRGRAGRTRPGRCYKLFSQATETTKMPRETVPEMLRTSLEQLCLQIKAIGIRDPRTFLLKAITPPSIASIDSALDTLRSVNALGEKAHSDLTALGKHMASIPADFRISKMLLFGSIFQCLDSILTIAACMTAGSPFYRSSRSGDSPRETFSTANSDLLADEAAFSAWAKRRDGGASRSEMRSFCEQLCLSDQVLHEIRSLRSQFLDSLKSIGFVDSRTRIADLDGSIYNANAKNTNLVKSIIAAGLYPNVARIKLPQTKFDQVLAGTIEREKEAREIKFYTHDEGRVFIHPSSTLFHANSYKSSVIVYFQKMMTSKTFMRDVTEVPTYALLLFGGIINVDFKGRGLTVGENGWIRLKAWPRIGVLVNRLRRLLDAVLEAKVNQPDIEVYTSPVVETIVALIANDGK